MLVNLFQHAHKVFEKIAHRKTYMRNSIFSLYHSNSCKNYPYHEGPVESFGIKENVQSWTSNISSLTKNNQPEESISLFKRMMLNEQKMNYVTVLSVMHAIGSLSWEGMTQEVHGLVVKKGFEFEVSIVTTLLGLYSIWNMEAAWKLFDQMPDKDVVLWSAMITAFAKSGHYDEAFECFREMQCNGVKPNHVSVVSILPSCAYLGVLSTGKQIHALSIKSGFYHHTIVKNSLVDMYVKCRNLETALQVFRRIRKKDLVSWKTMIHGCIENDCPREALDIFSKMRSTRSTRFQPNETIIHDIIEASLQTKDLIFGLTFHCYLLKCGFLASVSFATALLKMYAKLGEVDSAEILFYQLHKKDLIAWSAMISAYAQSRHPLNAFDTFRMMQSTKEKPNEITFVSLLLVCSLVGAQELGESIQAYVTKAGSLSNAFITSALIDLYCKLGRINRGRALFSETPTKDLVCWSSMINGYGLNGCGIEAMETFTNMLDCGIEPNDVVFISVLSACSHCGLEYEGWSWFYSMEEKYGIPPKLAHYACMVDLLSRRGNIQEAFEFVKNMPVEPDKRIWGALLAGCRLTPGYIDIAEFVAERLIALDPQNTSHYVILSNLYADQGRWRDVERLRKLVDEKGLTKTTGYSMIEVN